MSSPYNKLDSGIGMRHAKPDSRKPPIPKGHESDHMIRVGRRRVMRFIEIPLFALERKVSFHSRRSASSSQFQVDWSVWSRRNVASPVQLHKSRYKHSP